MRWATAALVLVVSGPVLAQVNSQPTEPPIVTAENDQWYRRGEPLVSSGEFYYPTGPMVFFNGDVMVRTGHYNGVPVYSDTTLEPYSILFVPIGRGQMQPYERVRGGELAGTSGSRPPSFPGRTSRMPPSMPIEAISSNTPEPVAVATTGQFAQSQSAEPSAVAQALVGLHLSTADRDEQDAVGFERGVGVHRHAVVVTRANHDVAAKEHHRPRRVVELS